MPHELNGKWVVTKEEAQPFYGGWNNLKVALYRYKDKPIGIKRVQLGGNGRVLLIDFDSLPPHIQHAIGDPRKVKHALEPYYKTDKEAVAFFANYTLADGAYLDHDYQNRYILNASVLRAAIAIRAVIEKDRKRKGASNAGIVNALCEHVRTFNKTLQVKYKEGHTIPESEKHFKRLLNAFESTGYKALVSGKHGNDNSRKVFDNTMALIESMFAADVTKPTPTEIHRFYDDFLAGHSEIINNKTGEVYNPADFIALSVATVTKYLSAWVSKIGTHAYRNGDRQKYMQQFKPYHSFNKPKFAGSILSIDDRQPPFKSHTGKRVWFYNGIDLGSEAFTCFVYGSTKDGIIKDFYRQLVRNYAQWGFCLPHELEAEMSLNSSFVNTFLQEGAMFQEVRIEANNARGKRIERYYGALRYQLEKKRVGWLARPFALSESNQPGNRDVPKLHYDEIIEGCLADIQTWNDMPHSEHKHLTRWQVFEQMQHPDLKPINYNSILFHLGHQTKTSCNAGIIKLQGGEYLLGNNGEVCAGEPLIKLLKRVEGKDIDVYWLDGNDCPVLKALIFIGQQLICEAVAKPTHSRATLERTAQDDINREIMSKYVATIEAFGRSRKKAIEPVTIIDNTPSRKKTFIMPGIATNTPMKKASGELMPEPPDEFEIIPVQSFVRDLRDRY